MSVTWRRVLTGSVVVAILLGIGVLEVFSARVRVDHSSSTAPIPGTAQPDRGQDFLISQGNLLGLEFGPTIDWEAAAPGAAQSLTGAVQTGRLTLLEINKEARRLVAVNGLGRVRVADVGIPHQGGAPGWPNSEDRCAAPRVA